jgi:hypothetical protein
VAAVAAANLYRRDCIKAGDDPAFLKPDIPLDSRWSFSMKSILARMPSMILAVAVLAAPVAAFAQAEPPVRVGNIWNWNDHQPTETEVQRQEKAAGIAPTPSHESSDTATLSQIYHQLLD